MKPLKIAILWHFHQPVYYSDGELLLPWVRLHGVKDYLDLPELFREFPDIKQTVNLVPSLSMQVDDYISGAVSDKIQRLTRIKASELSDEYKQEILDSFFICNLDNMILPYPRYKELYGVVDPLDSFEIGDWLDLQVWYNLTWIGQISRQKAEVASLFEKARDFSEEDKLSILKIHNDILSSINSRLAELSAAGQLEISATPMYHPILPLLCDTDVARESMPDVNLPYQRFAFPEDADAQISDSLKYYKNNLGLDIKGMWPSEGSLSDKALELMAKNEIEWAASDEEMLFNSVEGSDPVDKYFPRRFDTAEGEVKLLFRDHQLSDAIGFTYSNWAALDAAGNFMQKLRDIRTKLAEKYGDNCLDDAVVPVILDGENCWEFYKNNGIDFLRELYQHFSASDDIQTVTCGDAAIGSHCDFLPSISHIRAGSWINANFKIWIGHEDHRKAWSELAKVRQAIEDVKNKLSPDQLDEAMRLVYIAEGSDWFWWYGDEHTAPNKRDFDVLFRRYLTQIWGILGEDAPASLDSSLSIVGDQNFLTQPIGSVSPDINGVINNDEWKNAGFFNAKASMSSMHQIGTILKSVYFGSDDNMIYFRCDLEKSLGDSDSLIFEFFSPREFKLIFKADSFKFVGDIILDRFIYANNEVIEFVFSKSPLFDADSVFQLKIVTNTDKGEVVYPGQGVLEFAV